MSELPPQLPPDLPASDLPLAAPMPPTGEQIPLAGLAYTNRAAYLARPGLITTIGVLSIVIAAFSGVVSFGLGIEAFAFSMLSSIGSPSGVTSVTTTTVVSGPGGTRTVVTSSPGIPPPPAPVPPPVIATTAPTSDPADDASQADASPVTAPADTTGLTPQQSFVVMQRVQSQLPAGVLLTQAQTHTLRTAVEAPDQQLVPPDMAWSPVASVFAAQDGTLTIQFNGGGMHAMGGGTLQIDAAGNIVTQSTTMPPVMAGGPGFFSRINRSALIGMMTEAALSLALAILLLVSGIMMLRQSARSRKLHLIFACLKIPVSVLAGVSIGAMYGSFLSGISSGPASMIEWSWTFAMTVLGSAYPVALLIALNTRSMRDYFKVIQG